jgi:hypothetical protein
MWDSSGVGVGNSRTPINHNKAYATNRQVLSAFAVDHRSSSAIQRHALAQSAHLIYHHLMSLIMPSDEGDDS